MFDEIDPRVVSVGLNINGQLKTFSSPAYIASSGNKKCNAQQGEATVKLANLTKADQDYLLTKCSPYNKDTTPKILILSAGRVSTGTNAIFAGNITRLCPTQPPDIVLEFKAKENQFLKGKIIASAQQGLVPLSTIAAQVASDCGFNLNFEATDKNIANYAFSGAALKQVDKLAAMGGVNAWVDGDTLNVTNLHAPLKNIVRVLNLDSGLVGIPEPTEQGVRVKYLLDNTSKVGGALQIESQIYQSLSGLYRIYSLGWEISSREVPFYWIADCKRIDAATGAAVASNVPKKKGKRK